MGSSDRKIVSNMAYDIMRNMGIISWWCQLMDYPSTSRHCVIIYLLLQGKTMQDFGILFSHQRYHPAPFDKVEERLIEFFQKNRKTRASWGEKSGFIPR
jgi:hypothetical protein